MIPQTLRMSLLEASEGKIGSPVDHLFLYCFQYDSEYRQVRSLGLQADAAGCGRDGPGRGRRAACLLATRVGRRNRRAVTRPVEAS